MSHPGSRFRSHALLGALVALSGCALGAPGELEHALLQADGGTTEPAELGDQGQPAEIDQVGEPASDASVQDQDQSPAANVADPGAGDVDATSPALPDAAASQDPGPADAGAAPSPVDAGAPADAASPPAGFTCPPDCSCEQHDGRDHAFCTSTLAWDAARQACVFDGGELVRIESEAHNQWVLQQAEAGGLGSEPWLGGSDVQAEGSWSWTDGTSFWMGASDGNPVGGAYQNWAFGEPNNLFEQDCLRLGVGGGWDDTFCSDARTYVCIW